jgi:putative endonuclease
MAKHLEYGKQTEDLALEWFLKKFPAQLVARNYRCRMGELDLIFEQGRELIFVEVRARQPGAWVSGIESIGPKKLQRIRNTVNHFLVSYRGRAKQIRVDVMAWDGVSWIHLKNVWI